MLECVWLAIVVSEEKKEIKRSKRRRVILNAARALLLEKGYYNISMRQIAKLADMGTGTIYFYFKNKEEIYATLSEEVFDLILAGMRRASEAAGTPRAKLRGIAEALLEFRRRHKSYYDFLDYFIAAPFVIFPPPLKKRIDDYGLRVLGPIMDALREGVAARDFMRLDVREYALIYIASLRGAIHYHKLQGTILKDYPFDALYRRVVESFIKSLSPSIPRKRV